MVCVELVYVFGDRRYGEDRSVLEAGLELVPGGEIGFMGVGADDEGLAKVAGR